MNWQNRRVAVTNEKDKREVTNLLNGAISYMPQYSSIAQGDHQPLFKTMTRSTNLSCCQLHRIAHMISSSIVNQFEVSTRGILDSYLKYLFLVLCTPLGSI